jgi:hypothetical protein
MGRFLKGLGWFFGIIFLIFGLIILLIAFFGGESFVGKIGIIGFFVFIIGILVCYGAHRSGREHLRSPRKPVNDFFKEHEREFKGESERRRHKRRDKI